MSFLARLYESTGGAIAVTTASASASASALHKMLKFLVEVFRSVYLLNLWIALVDILPDVRYWSDILCCIILTNICDLEVKITGFEILCLSFWLKFLEVYMFWSFRWILLILCLILDTGLNFYAASSPSSHCPWDQGHGLWNVTLKFLVKVLEVDISWNFEWN